ncbi:MAG: family 20 glycosylhydrolase [Candidatus Cryptobacteroides sp.]
MTAACQNRESEVWSAEKAARWQQEKGWVSGCDFIPSNAINQLEMWQEDTFDPETIDRELGWAEELGFNCMRVFLHHKLWEQDSEGFKQRMDRYLSISDSHGISTMFVFFDDCWNEHYELGPQPEPVKGRHNSGWVKDPGALWYGDCGSGCEYAADTTALSIQLEAYVTDVISSFKDDDRIFAWDLYNEPGGGQDPDRYWERSFPLLKNVFRWARKVAPSQPLTAGVWNSRLGEMNVWQIRNSDIVTYHTYEPLESHSAMIDTLKRYGKPLVCTEYMARTEGSTFQSIMPVLKRENVGAINWGLVSGKTNTIFPWETMHNPCPEPEPELWFHDILRQDGTPYSEEEASCIKSVNGKLLSVIPYPAQVIDARGTFDSFGAKVSHHGLSPEEILIVEELAKKIDEACKGKSGKGKIIFRHDPSLGSEAYALDVRPDGITVRTSSHSGTLYAAITLAQMLPPGFLAGGLVGRQEWRLPCVSICDSPRFAYRGLELDCSRHFWKTDEIRKILDVMALYKLNRFHWHLTDDHGWRLEIKSWPRLTEVGAWRNGTMVGWDASHNDGIRYGGYYSQEEIRDIVSYAAERGIEIIPEIDLPAHMVSALAAYPELGCTGGPYEVFTVWDIAPDILCVGKESSFRFLEDVFREVVELFPGEYVHIGGDECPKQRWHDCPSCRKRMEELGLEDSGEWSAEHYLQNYVTSRVQEMLSAMGKKIIGWDEILEGDIQPGATIMSWRGTEGGIKAAKRGFDVIMTPTSHCYLDYCQGPDPKKEPEGIGHYIPLEKCYSYDPLDGLGESEYGKILGVQGNLWTEFIQTEEHLEYMLLPRMLALSEVQWGSGKNYLRLLHSLDSRHIPLLETLGYTCRRNPDSRSCRE